MSWMYFSKFCLIVSFSVANRSFYISLDTFYLLLGCPKANFGPLPRGQPQSPNVTHCIIQVSIRGSPGAS